MPRRAVSFFPTDAVEAVGALEPDLSRLDDASLTGRAGSLRQRARAVRDEVHLVALDGRTPLAEFIKTAGRGFEMLEEAIDESMVETFMKLEVGHDGVDWGKSG